MAGALCILPRKRVQPVDVSFTTTLKGFHEMGTGAGEFVQASDRRALRYEVARALITNRHTRFFSRNYSKIPAIQEHRTMPWLDDCCDPLLGIPVEERRPTTLIL